MVTQIQEKYRTGYGIRRKSRGGYTVTKSLSDAAGLLKDRYADLKKHYRKIRREWPSYIRVRR